MRGRATAPDRRTAAPAPAPTAAARPLLCFRPRSRAERRRRRERFGRLAAASRMIALGTKPALGGGVAALAGTSGIASKHRECGDGQTCTRSGVDLLEQGLARGAGGWSASVRTSNAWPLTGTRSSLSGTRATAPDARTARALGRAGAWVRAGPSCRGVDRVRAHRRRVRFRVGGREPSSRASGLVIAVAAGYLCRRARVTDPAKRRRQELRSAALLCPSRASLMRAPLSRSRPPLPIHDRPPARGNRAGEIRSWRSPSR